MIIKFYGRHTIDDTSASMASVLKIFQQRYGICSLKNLQLSLTLCDKDGHDVELVDAHTTDILNTFEVYPSGELREKFIAKNDSAMPSPLKLVIDNTK